MEIAKFAHSAAAAGGYRIEVAGFASSDGGETADFMLSEHRAAAAVQYLREFCGVARRRITILHGYCEMRPVANNSTRVGRNQNQRVELRLLANKGIGQKADKSASPH